MEKADLATINQETIIAKSYEPSGYPLFNSPQEVGEEVKKIGFDVVNLANNHMLDKGAKGLSEAIDFWNNIGGITMTGAYKDENDMNRLEYIEKDGIKIGLVGITRYTNGLSLPKDSALKIIYTSDEDTIKSKIQKAKAECDIVLVNVHWGEEYTTTPQQRPTRACKQNGVVGCRRNYRASSSRHTARRMDRQRERHKNTCGVFSRQFHLATKHGIESYRRYASLRLDKGL